MSSKPKLVAVSGSLGTPSRTTVLVDALVAGIRARHAVDVHTVEFATFAPQLGGALKREQLSRDVQRHLEAVESADFLIVASPVYRGSYTGLFKHFFDFVDHEALHDVPVLLGATGGSERHALVLEHQLRPLFSFFQSLTLPIGVYGTDADFVDYQVSSDALRQRIELAIDRALPYLNAFRPGQGGRSNPGRGPELHAVAG